MSTNNNGEREYVCASCHGRFTTGKTDAEARAELDRVSPSTALSYTETVCEPCYAKWEATVRRQRKKHRVRAGRGRKLIVARARTNADATGKSVENNY